MAVAVPSRGLNSSHPLILLSDFCPKGSLVSPVETGLSELKVPECAPDEAEDIFDVFFRLLLFFVRLEAPLE